MVLRRNTDPMLIVSQKTHDKEPRVKLCYDALGQKKKTNSNPVTLSVAVSRCNKTL